MVYSILTRKRPLLNSLVDSLRQSCGKEMCWDNFCTQEIIFQETKKENANETTKQIRSTPLKVWQTINFAFNTKIDKKNNITDNDLIIATTTAISHNNKNNFRIFA